MSLEEIITHDNTEDCVACRAQDIVGQFLIPAAAAWEATSGLPHFSLALHGAAGLLGTMLAEGIGREEVEAALFRLLEDIEGQIAEDQMIGGPPQGTA
jgi:hypothetical protein